MHRHRKCRDDGGSRVGCNELNHIRIVGGGMQCRRESVQVLLIQVAESLTRSSAVYILDDTLNSMVTYPAYTSKSSFHLVHFGRQRFILARAPLSTIRFLKHTLVTSAFTTLHCQSYLRMVIRPLQISSPCRGHQDSSRPVYTSS